MREPVLPPPGFGAAEPQWEDGREAVFLGTLENLKSAVERMAFPDGMLLRHPNDSDRSIVRAAPFFSLIGGQEDGFVLEVNTAEPDYPSSLRSAQQAMDRGLLALRLAHAGAVRLREVIGFQPGVPGSTRRGSVWFLDDLGIGVEDFVLAASDVGVVKRLHEGLPAVTESADLAFRRFQRARSRLGPEDRLIDYWIGLESLFAKEEETQELTYKYSLRIAHYLGGTGDQKLELFEAMKQAYGVRSRVVHGAHLSRKVIAGAASKTEETLRGALKRITLDGEPPNIEELDRRAASSRA